MLVSKYLHLKNYKTNSNIHKLRIRNNMISKNNKRQEEKVYITGHLLVV